MGELGSIDSYWEAVTGLQWLNWEIYVAIKNH